MARSTAPIPHNRFDRVVAVRFPQTLQHRVEEVAIRDATNFSNTVRRLIALGLRIDDRELAHHG